MLAIGSGRTPDNRAGVVIYFFAVERDTFAVALHVALLQVGGQFSKVMVIRQNCMAAGVKKIPIPHTEHGHDDRHVFFKGCLMEMFVHFVRARQ